MKLKLAEGVSLPIDAVTEKFCWLGRTGSGKTYGAMKLAELMLAAGAQIGALDPVGVWRALRVPIAKGGTAFDVVVFGGVDGDLPLEPHAGELIADLVVDRGLSFVLDVSQMIPSEQQRFVRDFAGKFFHLKKTRARTAVHLFIEECQEFVPENPSGDEAKTLGVMQRLWKLGRNFGIGGSLISQRPQEVSKKALNMSGTMFAFQMTGPQERATIKRWIADQGIAADIEGVLQKLKVGSPHIELHLETDDRVYEYSGVARILPRTTADLSGRVKVGASGAVARRPLTPIDVEKLRADMADTIERAAADDPRALRKRIADLERDLKTADSRRPIAAPLASALTEADRALLARIDASLVDLQRAEVPVVLKCFDAMKTEIQKAVDAQVGKAHRAVVAAVETKRFQEIARKLSAVAPPQLDRPHQRLNEAQRSDIARIDAAARPQSPMSAHAPRPRTPVPRTEYTGGTAAGNGHALARMPRAMLTTLAQHAGGLTKKQILIHTGYRTSGSVSDTFALLVRDGLVSAIAGNALAITGRGLDVLGPFDPLPVGDDLRRSLLGGDALSTMERALLSRICDHYPDAVAKKTVLELTNYKASGSVSDAFARLVALGYAVPDGPSLLKAARELFS